MPIVNVHWSFDVNLTFLVCSMFKFENSLANFALSTCTSLTIWLDCIYPTRWYENMELHMGNSTYHKRHSMLKWNETARYHFHRENAIVIFPCRFFFLSFFAFSICTSHANMVNVAKTCAIIRSGLDRGYLGWVEKRAIDVKIKFI